jgi:hypothetical protein
MHFLVERLWTLGAMDAGMSCSLCLTPFVHSNKLLADDPHAKFCLLPYGYYQ